MPSNKDQTNILCEMIFFDPNYPFINKICSAFSDTHGLQVYVTHSDKVIYTV